MNGGETEAQVEGNMAEASDVVGLQDMLHTGKGGANSGGGAGSADKPQNKKTLNIDPHHGADTTYKKLFIGGLAWQTTTERLKEHFSVFGELVEAIVISDKTTGRSKGYGFVTYARAEDATKALKSTSSPTIDGRRTNCNLAAFGNIRRDRPRNNFEGRNYGGGSRQQGPYYYDQQMMMYGNMGQMDNSGYGNMGAMGMGMGSPNQMMGSPNQMGQFNPYMAFPAMMMQPAAAGMMMTPQGFMMAPNQYQDGGNMMFQGGMQGGSPGQAPNSQDLDMQPLGAAMSELALQHDES
uniref:RRM domain-containing protein n=1 Tax=Hemiselmis tepida TaxID=464990 RepID=A0A7S0YWS6_9CRYP|mmetsp:Transcript_28114/g.71166  ORF Transcript_28114/g.71166 Transcript_28114/m.71166 type:complete len:294 (+) Transcript_28114:311-1192(+)